ncbi:MAG: hypothetical protein GXP61_08030 [Epsilonproteobacteria bacterium]|nr:hypothetical protein [Campylobacterota bacterium]
MIPLSISNKELKNALFDSGEWLVLLTFTNKNASVMIRVINNPEDVVFGGETFKAFPFQIDTITESNKGELPKINITLSNVDRIVQAYVEQDPDLGSGWNVHVDIVHNTALANAIAEIQYDFITMGATANESSVVFSCSMQNPLRYQFPRIRMLPNSCQHRFRHGGCDYKGADTSCTKTIQACRQKFYGASTIPFLAFPGIPTNAMYV